jgi:catechol 2,3-dioxygenase-like lactoylglutathione lyase family enzyme
LICAHLRSSVAEDALGFFLARVRLENDAMGTVTHRLMIVGFLAMTAVGCASHPDRKEQMNKAHADRYQLSLLKIPVTDIQRSAAFYHDTLGFEQQFVAPQYGWAQLKAGELPLARYKPGMGGGDGHVGGSTGFHLSLPAERFDTLAAALLVQGVLVENRVHHGDDGSVFIDVRDPDGNTLKIGREASEEQK